MTCEEFIARYLAGDRSPQADAHRRGCAACRSALPRLDQQRARLADVAVWESPSADLEARVLAAIDAGAAAAAAPGRPAPRRRRRGRWLGAVAAAVIVVAAAAFALVPRSEGAEWALALEATPAAAGAEARAEGWSSATGTRLRLTVEGLGPSGERAYYAIWLTSPDGRHVPAGTFHSSGTVTGWAGVDRDEFPRIWVTLERADGDESLSGPTVFDTPGA